MFHWADCYPGGNWWRKIFGPGPSTTLFRDATTIDETWALAALAAASQAGGIRPKGLMGIQRCPCTNFQCLDLPPINILTWENRFSN